MYKRSHQLRIQSFAKARSSKPTKNPPMGASSHRVHFVVIWSGNVNPRWTLVRFNGPSSFVSVEQLAVKIGLMLHFESLPDQKKPRILRDLCLLPVL